MSDFLAISEGLVDGSVRYVSSVDVQAMIGTRHVSDVDFLLSVSRVIAQQQDLQVQISHQVKQLTDLLAVVSQTGQYVAAVDLLARLSHQVAVDCDLQAQIDNQVMSTTDLQTTIQFQLQELADLSAVVSHQRVSCIDLKTEVSNDLTCLIDSLAAVSLGVGYSVSIDTLLQVANVLSEDIDLQTSITSQVSTLTDLLTIIDDAKQQILIVIRDSSAASVVLNSAAPQVNFTEPKVKKYDEGTTVEVPAEFLTAQNTPMTPIAAEYIVTDVKSKTRVLGPTAFTPSGPTSILVLPTEATQILNQENLYEDREVAIVISVDSDRVGVGKHVFRVMNVLGIQ